ncbi:hypothetical protein PGT21_011687 [Puccinia graminis f. sp. tritici]|uniref:Uncharacterized protein n=1 Tax=Puccinia graminis f. sp. tritici TaxID=56615 RepID=A0A5B0NSN3_PUCGR|nr:hypothetical protein PGTUg99_014340 [Puccinia graminis f. sp. tritici]KAA1099559.1 hypothetical protein PGT21_011687 [Puccinia graminis f. sp. tritici]
MTSFLFEYVCSSPTLTLARATSATHPETLTQPFLDVCATGPPHCHCRYGTHIGMTAPDNYISFKVQFELLIHNSKKVIHCQCLQSTSTNQERRLFSSRVERMGQLGFRSGPRRSGKIRKTRKPDQGLGSTQRDLASGRILKTPRSRGFAGITRIKPAWGPISCCTSAPTFPP